MIVRLIFSAACVAAGYHFHPFGLTNLMAAGVGLAFSVSVFLFEIRLQRASMRRLIGGAIGSILGILGAYLMGLILVRTSIPEGSRSFMDVALLLVMTYIGLVVGANKGDMLNLAALGGLFGSERSTRRMPKVRSSCSVTALESAGIMKLGQPQPESNLAPELNSRAPQPEQ